MGTLRILVLSLAVLIGPPALAQVTVESPFPNGGPVEARPERGPLHRLRLPGNPFIHDFCLSPDGHRLYVRINDHAVNVWWLLVYYWPEMLGTLGAGATLIALRAVWRISRRRQIVGEPYCHKCNYCLKGAPGIICSECGAPVKRPVIGRSFRRRIWPWLAPVALVMLLAGAGFVAEFPRDCEASTWFDWWSYELAGLAQRSHISLTRHITQVDRVLEIDVLTGETRRTLITQPYPLSVKRRMTVTPDGHGLLAVLGWHFMLVDTETGRVRRTFCYGNEFNGPLPEGERSIAGLSDDGSCVYFVLKDEDRNKVMLLKWDLERGDSCVVLELDASGSDVHDTNLGHRRCCRAPHSGRLLEMPDSVRFSKRPVELLVRDARKPSRVTARICVPQWGSSEPAFLNDGGVVVLRDEPGDFVEYDLQTGERTAQWRPGDFLFISECAIDDRNWMIVSTQPRRPVTRDGDWRTYAVLDLFSRQSLGWFVLPDGLAGYGVRAAANGQFFAVEAWPHREQLSANPQRELLIYDLRGLSAATTRPAPYPEPADRAAFHTHL